MNSHKSETPSVNHEDMRRLWNDGLQMARARFRIPIATYRLQMHAGFTLRDAKDIVPYLHRLGVSHLYVSSLLKSRAGSLHGYDVVDHSQLNPELGTDDDLEAIVAELHSRKMGLILDVVPNHMWVGEENEWWMDVLENGPSSRYASYFDIAWHDHLRERLRDKVLLPILDEPYGKSIQAGRLKPAYEHGRFSIHIDLTRLPLDTRTYTIFLAPALETYREQQGEQALEVLELQSILTAIRHLPPRNDPDSEHISEALAEGKAIQRRLKQLVDENSELVSHIDRAVAEIAGIKEHPESFARLIDLLDKQAYRPCFWRVALDEINYRRFFDVNDLAALAAERIDVFHAIHTKPFEWLRNGTIDGLRIDHVDGLLDPQQYLDRLQQHYVLGCAKQIWDEDPVSYGCSSWPDVKPQLFKISEQPLLSKEQLLYVVVEKILGSRELLPSNWRCDGTTGYEFLNEVNGLFIDSDHADDFTAVYHRFTKQSDLLDQIAYEKKLQILRSTMASELHVLSLRLDRLAQSQWWTQDFTLNGLRHALEEIIACFSVYRTYIVTEASASDRVIISRAARRARAMSPLLGREIFDFIRDTLLLKELPNGTASEEYLTDQQQFVGKFQQLTAPVMAKGTEDTALYTFNRLISLNEVGGEPAKFGHAPDELHAYFESRSNASRGGLSPLSTHDTKRSEDVRARINVLSELQEEWEQRIRRWHQLNWPHKTEIDDGVVAPDKNEEYLLYQTLVGVWPDCEQTGGIDADFIQRIQAYMIKAIREAKLHSSWIHPQVEYDTAVTNFVASILSEEKSAVFLADFREFERQLQPIGKLNSLAQTLIRCTAPGVPDTYQGTETWDYSLVDPDNRRPVDYSKLLEALFKLERLYASDAHLRIKTLRSELESGEAKLLVTTVALRLRSELADLFQKGEYLPVPIDGPDASHLFAFLICNDSSAVLVAVPRLIGALNARGAWIATELRAGIEANLLLFDDWSEQSWTNAFTGRTTCCQSGKLCANSLFAEFPVALLKASKSLP